MNLITSKSLTVCAVTLAAGLAATGCATKKYVRQTVAPVEQRVGEVDKKTVENASSIEELETNLSRTKEQLSTVETKADEATQGVSEAKEQAAVANRGVGEAKSLAEQGLSKADDAARKAENYDNYKLVSTQTVLFGFDKSDLSEEAKAQLGQMAQQVSGVKHLVIEVQGFTDRTGTDRYNLELSRRRAAAVVRYLTVEHKIPLYRIHVLGYGEGQPVADNTSRDGRKQNRRVEVRLFAAELGGGSTVQSTSLTNNP